jgi:hypothetical protein
MRATDPFLYGQKKGGILNDAGELPAGDIHTDTDGPAAGA